MFTKTSCCFQQISEKMEYTGELHYLYSDYTMLQAHLSYTSQGTWGGEGQEEGALKSVGGGRGGVRKYNGNLKTC